MIEELLVLDGIESAYSDFDYHNKRNVKIVICYDSSLINDSMIRDLEIKFNS